MHRALDLACRAERDGEVPVGAVVVKDGEVMGEGWNCPISSQDPTAHAEIVALRAAAKTLQNYRIPGTTLYVTLEPCPMCVGAMIHARVERLVFGAVDQKTGAAGGAFELAQSARHNHRLRIEGGVLEVECSNLLKQFFRRRR